MVQALMGKQAEHSGSREEKGEITLNGENRQSGRAAWKRHAYPVPVSCLPRCSTKFSKHWLRG